MSAATPEAVSAILASVPDAGDFTALEGWFAERLAMLEGLRVTPAVEASLCSVDVGSIVGAPRGPLGRFGDPVFRKLVVATLLADWGCYAAAVDRVGFERLLFVMSVFPAGFRLWWTEVPGGGWGPVGYTGWYPIAEATFEALASPGVSVRDRATMPLAAVEPGGSFLFLFNYSVLPAFRGGVGGRMVVRGLVDDVGCVARRGLLAITVSEDGARVAGRFGMERAGCLVVEGCEEWVYASRQGFSSQA